MICNNWFPSNHTHNSSALKARGDQDFPLPQPLGTAPTRACHQGITSTSLASERKKKGPFLTLVFNNYSFHQSPQLQILGEGEMMGSIKLLVYRDTSGQKTGEGSFFPLYRYSVVKSHQVPLDYTHQYRDHRYSGTLWFLLLIKAAVKSNVLLWNSAWEDATCPGRRTPGTQEFPAQGTSPASSGAPAPEERCSPGCLQPNSSPTTATEFQMHSSNLINCTGRTPLL